MIEDIKNSSKSETYIETNFISGLHD